MVEFIGGPVSSWRDNGQDERQWNQAKGGSRAKWASCKVVGAWASLVAGRAGAVGEGSEGVLQGKSPAVRKVDEVAAKLVRQE